MCGRKVQGVPLAIKPGICLITPNTNEDIATKFEQEYVRCMRNEEECVCSRCNILISGKIITEMAGSVASGTPCITL